MLQEGQAFARDPQDEREKRIVGDHDTGAGVVQQEFVVVGAKQGVDRNRNCADFDGAEKTVEKFRDIREQKQDAFLDANVESVAQSCAEAIDVLGKLQIGDALLLALDSDFIAAAILKMAVDKIFGGVESVLGLFGRKGHEGRVYLRGGVLKFKFWDCSGWNRGPG